MSSAEVAAKVVKNLEPEDYKLLKVLASGLKQHESLTRKEITTYSKIHENIVDFRINRLHDMKLIRKNKGGFTLLMMGLDTVALKMLVDKDIIIAMGKPIGIGKESDVFEAITSRKQGRALKFFRIGRISFREVRRRRTFIGKEDIHQWLLVNIDAAKKEYNALNRLRHSGIRIPVLYYRAMHCVVMNRIDGLRLVNIHELEDPKITLQNILHDIGTAYKYNMINSDLSEYNVLLDSKNNIWIIDWPQVVSRSHPNAADLIKRDVYNIVNFFNRRFDLRKDKDEALNEVVLQ
ncbi:MAG TPA: RIO1 family regulatory kinase/ATPase [Nitrososphaeraceae archaeon]|jgi:RIO kinase 2|nr:RIO1 family regulatory kinase/ATPase [Nitrososphaeraceae archaeon]